MSLGAVASRTKQMYEQWRRQLWGTGTRAPPLELAHSYQFDNLTIFSFPVYCIYAEIYVISV